MTTALRALIERLEKAEKGSRELDFWCWWYGASTESKKRDPRSPPEDYVARNLRQNDAPRYTISLDAALSLVPEGWDWTLYSDGSGEIYRDVPPGMLPDAPGSTVIGFDGQTPPLGICIACLRAKEHDHG